MLETILNWITDIQAHTETLDLNFVETHLVDISLTEAEKTEISLFDSMASQVEENSDTPIGKQVL